MVPLNSQLPAAVQSGSITFGGTTVSVLLQAIDGGLRARGRSPAPASPGRASTRSARWCAADLTYVKAEDFIGKKVGAPGIGAFLQVLFRNWLLDNGVDYKKVTFVEVGFPQMADVLKGGNVDAVVTGEPVMGRIVAGRHRQEGDRLHRQSQERVADHRLFGTRKWVEANRAAVKAFQEAIAEGAAIANKDQAAVRAAVANYIKMPPEVIASMKLGRWQAAVTEAGIAGWVDIMKRQDMLRSAVDAKTIIARLTCPCHRRPGIRGRGSRTRWPHHRCRISGFTVARGEFVCGHRRVRLRQDHTAAVAGWPDRTQSRQGASRRPAGDHALAATWLWYFRTMAAPCCPGGRPRATSAWRWRPWACPRPSGRNALPPCLPRRGLPTMPTNIRANFPAACSSVCRLPAAWHRIPRCC